MNSKSISTLLSFICLWLNGFSQYAPAAGKPGSTALFMDSSIFINWAEQCNIKRGWKNCDQKDSGFATIGDGKSACGKAGTNGVVSLGDSGVAICQFQYPIKNGTGFDFAVFENTFDDRFLELAFVEVSSDGINFVRFPCHSLSDTFLQTSAFGYTEPENINNLAGKYRYGYGTPFDLDELPKNELLDTSNIRYIKIIDIVGSLNPKYASFDHWNRKINDPWPTPFASSGFDLDAIGIIHEKSSIGISLPSADDLIIGQNPIYDGQRLKINIKEAELLTVKIFNSVGQLVRMHSGSLSSIEASDLPYGLFYIHVLGSSIHAIYKGLKL